MTIHQKPTEELRINPGAKAGFQWGDDAPEFISLCTSISESGILQPIIIDNENRIMDGRHRWRAAKRLGIEQVPTVTRPESELPQILLESLINRRHLTKSALAYESVPAFEAAYDGIRKKQSANLRNPTGSDKSTETVLTAEDIAERLGISRVLLFQARKIRQIFESDEKTYKFTDDHGNLTEKTLRDAFEPQIYAGSISLDRVLAGIEGIRSTDGKKPSSNKPKYPQLIVKSISAFARNFRFWGKLSEGAREEIPERLTDAFSSLPEEVLEAIQSASKAALKAKRTADE